MADRDEVIDVLFRPWRIRPPALSADDTVLFLGAQVHPQLAELGPRRLVAVQPWRPAVRALQLAGFSVRADDRDVGTGHASALVLPERQREASRAWLGRAVLAVRPGGEVVACAAAREGGARLAEDLAELLGEVDVDSKARCKVVRGHVGAGADLTKAAAWSELDAPVTVEAGMHTRPGLFAWDHVDEGSSRLARLLPDHLGDVVVDAGCGWGYLGAVVLGRPRPPRVLHLIDADARALASARVNLASRKRDAELVFHWEDATGVWPVSGVDAVVSNPPFHLSGTTDPSVGAGVIRASFAALRPGGSLWMVANRHLPYEKVLYQTFGKWDVVDERGGYKVVRAERR